MEKELFVPGDIIFMAWMCPYVSLCAVIVSAITGRTADVPEPSASLGMHHLLPDTAAVTTRLFKQAQDDRNH